MNQDFPDGADEQQLEEAYRVAGLIAAFIRGTISSADHDELDKWVAASHRNLLLFERLTDPDNLQNALRWCDEVEKAKALKNLKAKIQFNPPKKNISVGSFWRYAAAAILILLAGTTFFISRYNSNKQPKAETIVVNTLTDLSPGTNKAILTLADGSTILLDSARDGTLVSQRGSNLVKASGKIIYKEENGVNPGEVAFNIITVPRGGQYRLQLADGTDIWLNAASSIRYPVAFPGKERKVEITGEAYFEVAKNKEKPFLVRVGNEEEVRVLGTHFNIHAYPEEKSKVITLLEGSVEISSGKGRERLLPGEQGRLHDGSISKIKEVDAEEIIGWKDGQFVFHDADIQSIMQQVSRWYDVEVKFEANPAVHFNATVSRNESVSRLLRLLQATGQVHFKIENKTIYVLP